MPRIEMIKSMPQLQCRFELQEAGCRSSGRRGVGGGAGGARRHRRGACNAVHALVGFSVRSCLGLLEGARANTFENQIAVQTETMPLRLYYGLVSSA